MTTPCEKRLPRKRGDKTRSTRSQVRSALHKLWMRSRERATALKATKYCCARCGIKQSKAAGREVKVVVHHKAGVGNWDSVIDAVFDELLCPADMLETLCVECHKKEHAKV